MEVPYLHPGEDSECFHSSHNRPGSAMSDIAYLAYIFANMVWGQFGSLDMLDSEMSGLGSYLGDAKSLVQRFRHLMRRQFLGWVRELGFPLHGDEGQQLDVLEWIFEWARPWLQGSVRYEFDVVPFDQAEARVAAKVA
mmetsp:Transcript_39530/g.58859  ORF Transcript_39530/g.58859 Transcript_39530/m.58859 type:complete len:138 (+) Transcript_39530:1-414(+)